MINKLTTTTSLSLVVCAALRVISQRGLQILLNSTMAVATTCALVGVLNAQQPRAVSEQQKFQSNLRAAIKGNRTAQGKIGYAYEYGKGTEKDLEQAVTWYRKAALQGSAYGQYNLGDMYEHGKGVKKDLQRAARWYQKAAEQGNSSAQDNLAYAYLDGRGISKDLQQAAKWYRKAAEQGHSVAQVSLGLLYEHGEGVEKDFEQAAQWYRKAAEQGDSSAQYRLAIAYEEGKGTKKDLDEAVAWYRKAAIQGDKEALRAFASLAAKTQSPGILRRELGVLLGKKDTPETIEEMMLLYSVLRLTDLDTEAVELLTKALAIQERLHGKESLETTNIRSSLSDSLRSLGDHEARLILARTNAEIAKRKFGNESFQFTEQLYQIGAIHMHLENHLEAIESFSSCVNFQESLRARTGKRNQDLKTKQQNMFLNGVSTWSPYHYQLARALEAAGELEQSRKILSIYSSAYDEAYNELTKGSTKFDTIISHPAEVLHALVLLRLGLPEQAAEHFAKKGSLFYCPQVFAYLGLAEKKAELEGIFEIYIQNDADGSHGTDPDRCHALRAYADHCVFSEQWNQAIATQEQARQKLARYTLDRLPRLSSSHRRRFIEEDYIPSLHKALTLGLLQRSNPRASTLSAGWLLNGKSVTEEALAEAALLSSEEAFPIVQKLNEVRQQLASISVSRDTKSQESKKRIAELEAVQSRLSNDLTKFSLANDDGENWVPIGSVMTKLPLDSRLVSIAKIRPFEFPKTYTHLKRTNLLEFSHHKDAWLPERYVAWVVPPVGTGNVQCVDLGEASDIDRAIADVRSKLVDALNEIDKHDEAKAETELKLPLEKLSDLVLKPLKPHIEDADELIVSPDGELWTIPWEMLLADDSTEPQYLIESKRIRYLGSGRELVRTPKARSAVGAPVVFANPNYDLDVDKIAGSTVEQFALCGVKGKQFPALSFSAVEANAILPSVKEYTSEEPKLFDSYSAQEATFKDLHRPEVLVISTHGYFDSESRISNPLLRCGLAMAGANNRESAAAEGKEDGILTGLEIVGTDLRGTELVVLSACETGLGDIANGEGVAGLRQAFQLAGAQSVVSSLWQVEDGETARLMKHFFENLAAGKFEGKSKSEALRQAQLSRIKARRARHGAAHPFFWAAFTLTGQD